MPCLPAPVYAKLYRETNNRNTQFMDNEYRATYEYLFDKEENLFLPRLALFR